MQTLNVIDTAIRTGIFQTFTRLLEGSQLERRLRGQESFTVFAPVDISFAYLSTETYDDLLKAGGEGILMDVLGYHVVPRQIMFRELCTLCKTPTVC
ncbi:MAG TPA: fasciclin domain-containing protein, partial [Pyrinomonadaceae bacterium]|nr:fasciclin domain-containing protein [Pyrinomonadaceae bacterium]